MEEKMTIMPMIMVDSVEKARSFYVEQLGFRHQMGMLGKDGNLDFVNVVLGTAPIMLMRPQEKTANTSSNGSRQPVEIYMQVPDVDSYHKEVAGRGVKITTPLTDQWWGDRTFTVTDPYGYHIWFFQRVGQPNPPKGAKLV
jgi:PhnB protein